MSKSLPCVSVGYQESYLSDLAVPTRLLRLDSPAWFAWLDEATTTRFAYPVFDPALGAIVGTMTVRKERRQRGGAYWAAFRRCGGRVRKAYLGHAATLTAARLSAIAAAFHHAAQEAEKGGVSHAHTGTRRAGDGHFDFDFSTDTATRDTMEQTHW